jgi:hypothetical protein
MRHGNADEDWQFHLYWQFHLVEETCTRPRIASRARGLYPAQLRRFVAGAGTSGDRKSGGRN